MNPLHTFFRFTVLAALSGMIWYGIEYGGGFMLYFAIPVLLGIDIAFGIVLALLIAIFSRWLNAKLVAWLAPLVVSVFSLFILTQGSATLDSFAYSGSVAITNIAIPTFVTCGWGIVQASRDAVRDHSEPIGW